MNQALALLEAGASKLGVHLPPTALDRFDRYLQQFVVWQERLNLIGTADPFEIVSLHFIDALLPLSILNVPPESRIVDVGSGAGLPGIPMWIARPDLKLTLIEASRRRVAFIEHLRTVLAGEVIEIVWSRAEDVARRARFREAFAVAVERAAARVRAAAELCLPFVEVGGATMLLKGPAALDELSKAAPLVAILGGAVESSRLHALPGTEHHRAAIVLRKVGPTPNAFPRRGKKLGQAP